MADYRIIKQGRIMGRVVHFEITADQPERAVAFYRHVFGWDIQRWDSPEPYWLVSTGKDGQPGIDGAIMPRLYNQAVINTVDVADLDAAIILVKEAGGEMMGEKQDIPGVGSYSYARDGEGNIFGIMQAVEPKPEEGAGA